MYPVAFSLSSSRATPPPPQSPFPTVSTPLASVFSLGAPKCRQVISPLFLGHKEARVFGGPLPTTHRAGGLGEEPGGMCSAFQACAVEGAQGRGLGTGALLLLEGMCRAVRINGPHTMLAFFFPDGGIFPVKRPPNLEPRRALRLRRCVLSHPALSHLELTWETNRPRLPRARSLYLMCAPPLPCQFCVFTECWF